MNPSGSPIAKALPFAVKGLLGTVQLPPEAKNLLDTIKADKMAALKEIANSNDYSILVTGATGFIGNTFNFGLGKVSA